VSANDEIGQLPGFSADENASRTSLKTRHVLFASGHSLYCFSWKG
jgi:hypothetical protein